MGNPQHLQEGRPGRSAVHRGNAPADPLRWGLLAAGLAGLAAVLACQLLLDISGALLWGLAALGFALIWLIVARQMRRGYPHGRIGACNAVTLIRVALALALVPPLLAGQPAGWIVAGIAGVALVLDGLDGSLARRQGLVSDFGARFDMEADSILALILSLHVVAGSAVGAEGLILGLARYAFVGAMLLWPWLSAPLPQKFRRKTICVVQMVALILLLLPILTPDAAILVARLAAALVVWSFAVDILWLRGRAG
ncbi:CDP-alcohol phosphatidyltransferase family protein [uncultured Paracoccus sp.]|uniref:CDP-alcohol phosphatidyltransferase family protein n=1 Tax=uncultured Paracoccus sp. TaxID=189685 RepID=UPI002608BB88|nr:CDP-alcohol phosphatidyltransferase family protein [uncultured Paracoccus sp.]